jgi:hypothetical protein
MRDDSAEISGTAATCTIANTDTTCSWTGTSGVVSAGSKINLKIIGSATAAAAAEMIVSWCNAP